MSSARHGHQARKRFGQNFLHDMALIDRIVATINPRPDDNMLEIGPGLGALTEPLLEANPRLRVVELDRDLIPVLRTKFFNYPDFEIFEADALKFDYRQLADRGPLRIVGNLPYNISTPLMFHLLGQAEVIADMHFMLQKEVVDRLSAQPGEKHWGRLAIMTQYHCRVEPLIRVPPEAFKPRPKVDSAIVRLVPHERLPSPVKDEDALARVVRTAFNARRKTLRKALAPYFADGDWEAVAIDPGLRPEKLTLADFAALADHLADREGKA